MKQPKSVNELADELLDINGPAAIVGDEWLRPVGGRGSVIYPPTFAPSSRTGENPPYGMSPDGKSTYNIDDTPDGKKVAIIDSIPSQANRIEKLFRKPRYDQLVPQITIKAGEEQCNLLEIGHRAADAFVRYSKLGDEVKEAFQSYKRGDANKLAKLAPTTLVFGGWDSRDTQAKCARIVASEIRAYDVTKLHRSSTYIPPVSYKDLGLLGEGYSDKQLSELGFLHNPATHQLGGIIVRGKIQRKTVLNLTTLRDVRGDDTLHHYLLGLALVAFTHEEPYNLRQGCQLVRDAEERSVMKLVSYDGTETELALEPSAVLAYAQRAAKQFVVGKSRTVEFDADAANAAIEERRDGTAKKGRKEKAAIEERRGTAKKGRRKKKAG
jgi:CRISPR-associated protein Csb1